MTAQMEQIFTYVPTEYNDALKQLVETGSFPSRSEAIREAIKLLLKDRLPFLIDEARNRGSLVQYMLTHLQKELEEELEIT